MNKLARVLIVILTLAILTSLRGKKIRASEPLEWVKNKYGIHITNSTGDIGKAGDLLNSNGGDWSWITIVIRKDELNKNQWQTFFDTARRRHLIPIVRIASKLSGSQWKKPQKQDLELMASFLTELNWPTKNKFVVIYNEPNRGDEWGGQADPKEYAEILSLAGKIFKQKDNWFHIISGGLDLAAPQQPPRYYSAEEFYRQMILYKPNVFENIDSLASHSYPNHRFIGSPQDGGKTSVRGYQWELNYLASLGVKKDLTVFITETGWPHQEGEQLRKNFYHSSVLLNLFKTVFKFWEQDKRIVAFTPFILNYPYPPFDHFSWQDKAGHLYPHSQAISKTKKENNHPPQLNKGKIMVTDFSFLLIPRKRYQGRVLIKNTGQMIWGENDNIFCFTPKNNDQAITVSPLCQIRKEPIEPGQSGWFKFSLILEKEKGKVIDFGWGKIRRLEIKPVISPKTHLYRQKTGLRQKIIAIANGAIKKLNITQFNLPINFRKFKNVLFQL